MENITNNLTYLIPEIIIIALGFIIIGIGIFTRIRNKFILPFASITGLIFTAIYITFFFDIGNIHILSTTDHNQMKDLLIYGGLLKLDSFSLLFKFIFIILGIFVILMSSDDVLSTPVFSASLIIDLNLNILKDLLFRPIRFAT